MKPFIQELPRHYGRSPQDAELQRALENMAARAEADKDFTLEQLFPSTASGWGLALWEEAYGLRREAGQTDVQRRARVLAKIKGIKTTTMEQIRAIAMIFAPWRVQIQEFPQEYRFEICFLEVEEAVDRLEALRAAVNEIKPAHLAWHLRETFRPISFQTKERMELFRMNVRTSFFNLQWTVLLGGSHPLDGNWTLGSQAPGIRFPHIDIQLSARNENQLSGWLVRNTMWLLDGDNQMDGRKKLNAGIFKEEF